MDDYTLTPARISNYARFLREEERSPATTEKYLRDIRAFAAFLDSRAVTKDLAVQWKEHLLARGYAPATINSKLSAMNGFFRFMGWNGFTVKFLKLQRRPFRDASRELAREEYSRLLECARYLGKGRLELLMETICSTGIRVSEVRYITVEAARMGRADVSLKGKIRTILLPNRLCRKLLKFAKKQQISSGEIFLTKDGGGMSRFQIWREMKSLCRKAGIEATKVFPHNLRHLFASVFYRACKDIVKLADVLGHSSIDTTRIYLQTTGLEHTRQLERLGLIQ